MYKKHNGFSLIELLIVVVIILIIAAIAIPNRAFNRSTKSADKGISTLRDSSSFGFHVHGRVAVFLPIHQLGGSCWNATHSSSYAHAWPIVGISPAADFPVFSIT